MRIPDPAGASWVDGRRVPPGEAVLPLHDPIVQSGFGLFETLAIREGRPLELREHLERMEVGAERLAIALPPRESLERCALEAAASLGYSRGWLKVFVSGSGRWFVFGGASPADEEGRPARAILLPWRRSLRDPLAGIKSTSYAGNVAAAAWARSRGGDEGIWLNTRGHVAEGCSSNVFVLRGRKLLTPGPKDGILPGVVRGLALVVARELHLRVHEGKLRLIQLERADEAFLTSSVRGIRPLISWQDRPVGPGEPGPWTREISRLVAERRGLAAGAGEAAPEPPGGA